MMSDCSCIYVDSDNRPEFYSERRPFARKEHTCYECGRKIEIGEKYENVAGKWGDGFSNYKTCIDCLSIRDQFFCQGFFYGELCNDLWEHISEMAGQISADCILELTPGARDRVLDMIDRLWEDE